VSASSVRLIVGHTARRCERVDEAMRRPSRRCACPPAVRGEGSPVGIAPPTAGHGWECYATRGATPDAQLCQMWGCWSGWGRTTSLSIYETCRVVHCEVAHPWALVSTTPRPAISSVSDGDSARDVYSQGRLPQPLPPAVISTLTASACLSLGAWTTRRTTPGTCCRGWFCVLRRSRTRDFPPSAVGGCARVGSYL